jgi:amino acid transporter
MSENTATASAESERTGFSLSQAVAVGINTTSPAYSLAAILAPMAALVGYATPIVLIVSFIPMALTSLAFLYLNRRDPDCGTTFSWVTRAMGPIPGFMAGWAIIAAGVLVLGSLAETAVTYGLLLFGLDGLAANRLVIVAGAAVLIMIMVVLAIVGSDSSIRLQSVLTYVQIGILLAFGAFAFYTATQYGLPSFTTEWVNPLEYGVQPLVAAMLLGVFAFWGWEAATNLSEECRKPSDAGKAGLLSTVILLVTYVLVAISVVLYLGQSDFFPVGESGLVLVDMAGSVFGPLSFLVLIAVATSALASTQTTMVPGSRAGSGCLR